MMYVWGLVLCGLLMPSQVSGTGRVTIPQPSYEKACDEYVSSLFRSEMEKLRFPGLTITLITINGLHVAKVTVLPVKSEYVPGLGVKLGISASVRILGNCWSILLSGLVTINVHVHCTTLVLLPTYVPLNTSVAVRDCQCVVTLLDISISLLDIRASVTASLGNNIVSVLKVKTPAILAACISFGHSTLLNEINCVLPFEKGKLMYVAETPKVTHRLIEIPVHVPRDKFQLEIKGLFFPSEDNQALEQLLKECSGCRLPWKTEYLANSRKKIPIPALPKGFVMLPELNETAVALGENVLTAVLGYKVFKKPHSFPCTTQTFHEALSLELVISEVIVSQCSTCTPIASSLIIVIKLLKPLKVSLDVNLCIMNISLRLEITDKKENKKPLNLIALQLDLGLTATLQLVEGKVLFVASVNRVYFKLLSSVLGTVNIVRLHAPLQAFVQAVILKEINLSLHLGKVPIPQAPGLMLSKAHCLPSKRCLMCHSSVPKKG